MKEVSRTGGVMIAGFASSLLLAAGIGIGVSFALSGAVLLIAHASSAEAPQSLERAP